MIRSQLPSAVHRTVCFPTCDMPAYKRHGLAAGDPLGSATPHAMGRQIDVTPRWMVNPDGRRLAAIGLMRPND